VAAHAAVDIDADPGAAPSQERTDRTHRQPALAALHRPSGGERVGVQTDARRLEEQGLPHHPHIDGAYAAVRDDLGRGPRVIARDSDCPGDVHEGAEWQHTQDHVGPNERVCRGSHRAVATGHEHRVTAVTHRSLRELIGRGVF
jgi:hypothetical protein